MTDETPKAVSVESALRSILRLVDDKTLTEKRLRIQTWGFAKAALELLEAGSPSAEKKSFSDTRATDTTVRSDVPIVAWLHVWSPDRREVRRKLADDKYGLHEAIPLQYDEWGEILAWQWADGGGYNSSHRYSFVDPLENPDEVEAQNAESVIGCRPLYRHPIAKGYKA